MKALTTTLFAFLALSLSAQSFRSITENTNTHFIVGPPLFWTYQKIDPLFSNAVNAVAIGVGSTNISLAAVTNAGTAAYSNATAFAGASTVVTTNNLVRTNEPLAISLTNAANALNGAFTGNGAGVTNLNAPTNLHGYFVSQPSTFSGLARGLIVTSDGTTLGNPLGEFGVYTNWGGTVAANLFTADTAVLFAGSIRIEAGHNYALSLSYDTPDLSIGNEDAPANNRINYTAFTALNGTPNIANQGGVLAFDATVTDSGGTAYVAQPGIQGYGALYDGSYIMPGGFTKGELWFYCAVPYYAKSAPGTVNTLAGVTNYYYTPGIVTAKMHTNGWEFYYQVVSTNFTGNGSSLTNLNASTSGYTNQSSAPTLAAFTNQFGATWTATNHLLRVVGGALTDYWATNGSTVWSKQLAP
jgi:hypothetical protein